MRRCRIDLPFTDVVCTQHSKVIRVFENAQIDVVVKRSLVFLAQPEPGDLRDLVPITAASDTPIHNSPDSLEILRTATSDGTLIHWLPREPIVLYAQYVHQHGWSYVNGSLEAALYTELHCDMRTGTLDLEIVTPGSFEAAIAFKRPRWRRLGTERKLVAYALQQLETPGERPAIAEDGARVEWKLAGPMTGDRYICVAFQQGGVELWRQRLQEKSLAYRLRRLIRPLTSNRDASADARGKRVAVNLNRPSAASR